MGDDLLSGFRLFCTFGFVGAAGAAGASRRALPAPVGQAKAHEQRDENQEWDDEVFQSSTPSLSVAAINPL
jgi:hypothetical protein